MTQSSQEIQNNVYTKLIHQFKNVESLKQEQIQQDLTEIINSSNIPNDIFFGLAAKAAYDVNINEYRGFRALIENSRIYKELHKQIEIAISIVSRSKNEANKLYIFKMFTKLCFAIEYSFQLTTSEAIDLELIHTIWKSLKIIGLENPRYVNFNIPYLLFCKIIELKYSNDAFKTAKTLLKKRKAHKRAMPGKVAVFNLEFKYPKWSALFEEWCDQLPNKSTKSQESAFQHFLDFLDKNNLIDDPIKTLNSKINGDLVAHFENLPLAKKYDAFSYIYKFTCWIVDEVINGEGQYIANQSQLERMKVGVEKRPSESTKESMPAAWIQKCKEILQSDDHAWPKSLSWQYFNWLNPETNVVDRIWSPVISYEYLLMLELPIRKIQAQQLDSGEGDSDFFNLSTLKWQINHNVHANYWLNRKTRRNQRGVITKLYAEGKPIAGIYINTNKTQDIQQGFDETCGYEIPWQNFDALKIIDFIRGWQEKYNPVPGPLPFRDAPTSCWSSTPSKTAYESVPPRFYLFRNPCGSNPQAPTSDSNLFKFWHLLMLELEKRLNEEGHDVKIVLGYDSQGVPCRSLFTPHGLRVAGLTALLENGVPIEVLSKLVAGHASIVMTLYYIKYSPGRISEILDSAKHKMNLQLQSDFAHKLKKSNFEEAKNFAVANSLDALNIHHRRYEQGAKMNYSGSPIGLCPHNGTACDTGGPIVRKNGDYDITYGPVEGGVGNCARCRYLITGTPWLINLWLEGNKKLAESQRISKEIDNLKIKLVKFEALKFESRNSNDSHEQSIQLNKEIDQLETSILQKSKLLNEALLTSHAIHNLIQKVRELSANDESNDNSLVLKRQPQNSIDYAETSRFETLDILVRASEIWTHIEDEDMERERNNFIDQVMFNSGIKPISFSPLSEMDKKNAINSVSDYLLSALKREELMMLEEGHTSLEDLGLIKGLQTKLTLIAPVLQENLISFRTGTR